MKHLLNITISLLFVLALSTSASIAAQNGEIDLHEGLIAFYPFNGNANDGSGNAHDGAVYNAVLTEDRYGNQESAFGFDGSNDYIVVPYSEDFHVNGEVSISFWMKRNEDQGGSFDKGFLFRRSAVEFNILVYDNGKLRWNDGGNGTCTGPVGDGCNGVRGATSFVPLQWTHYAFTIDADGNSKLYENGILIDEGLITLPQGETEPLVIGNLMAGNSSGTYNGVLDDIAIYNRALTEEEVEALYRHPGGAFPLVIEEANDAEPPADTRQPTGAIHAHDNLIWPPNNKTVKVTLDGYLMDELSMAREGEGIGVSYAYILVNLDEKIILRDENIDLLKDGKFSVDINIKAEKGAGYLIELFAADTNPEESGGTNSGPVDSTYIRVSDDMSWLKFKKRQHKSFKRIFKWFRAHR